MSEFQKRGTKLRGENNHRLKFKCDICGKVIDAVKRLEKNGENNGGYARVYCNKCKGGKSDKN